MRELLYEELSYSLIGASMEVHKLLGPGFLEAVYQKALAHELKLRSLIFLEHVPLPVSYKGEAVGDYVADFVADGKIILEIKSVSALTASHQAQAIHYLAATGQRLALLINFGVDSLQHKRIIR